MAQNATDTSHVIQASASHHADPAIQSLFEQTAPTPQTTNRYFVFRGTNHFPTAVRVDDHVVLNLYEYFKNTPDRDTDLPVNITHIDTYPRSMLITGKTTLDDTHYKVEILLHQNDTFANLVTLIPIL